MTDKLNTTIDEQIGESLIDDSFTSQFGGPQGMGSEGDLIVVSLLAGALPAALTIGNTLIRGGIAAKDRLVTAWRMLDWYKRHQGWHSSTEKTSPPTLNRDNLPVSVRESFPKDSKAIQRFAKDAIDKIIDQVNKETPGTPPLVRPGDIVQGIKNRNVTSANRLKNLPYTGKGKRTYYPPTTHKGKRKFYPPTSHKGKRNFYPPTSHKGKTEFQPGIGPFSETYNNAKHLLELSRFNELLTGMSGSSGSMFDANLINMFDPNAVVVPDAVSTASPNIPPVNDRVIDFLVRKQKEDLFK